MFSEEEYLNQHDLATLLAHIFAICTLLGIEPKKLVEAIKDEEENQTYINQMNSLLIDEIAKKAKKRFANG